MWSKLIDFSRAPVFPDDEAKTRRAGLLHYGSLMLFVFPLILISFNLLFGSMAEKSINWVLGLIAILQVVIQRMIRSGFVNEASLVLLILGWAAMTEISRSVNGVRDVAMMGYVLILLASGYLLGWRAATLFTLASIAAIWWLVVIEMRGLISPALGNPDRIALDLTVLFVLVFLVIYFMLNTLTRSLERAQRELAERLRTEKILEGEQERLHLALDAARMGTWDLDIETGTILWSEKIEVMFGIEKGEFDGRYETYLSRLHPEDRLKVENAIQLSLADENKDYLVEHRLVWPSGEIRWLEGRGRVYRNETGRPFRMAGTIVDVTQRKASEGALRRAEEKYRGIVENALGGIFQSTIDGHFVSVNPAMARMYGYESPEDMVGSVTDMASQLYVEPGLRAELRSRLEAGEKIINFEALEYRKDKSTFWISMNVQAIRDEHGNILYYEGAVEDISSRRKVEEERKQAEKELQQREAYLRAILDNFPFWVWLKDAESRFLAVNKPLARDKGYDHPELLAGKTDFDITSADLAEKYQSDDRSVMASRTQRVVEEAIIENGNETWVETFKSPIFDLQGNAIGTTGFVRDITERKRAEIEREELIAKLESKNTELERFTYTVSHDLKAPLVTISGFLGYLEKHMASGNFERFKLDSQRIRDAVDKMRRLLDELLELSRIGRMMNPPQTIPFVDLVNDALEAVRGQLDARGITVQIQPNLPLVYGDRQRLTEVLQNLVDNAAKFIGDTPNPKIEIGQHGREGDKLIFYVRDNGIGIPLEYHERIFGLFNKLDSSTDGTGIGLAIVKRIIEFHGGRIWVESEGEGRGATFLFTLTSQRNGERL